MSMAKPTYQELEEQIISQNESIECLKKFKRLFNEVYDSVPKMFKFIELIHEGDTEASDYYYRYVNPAFEKLVGKTKEELIGKRFTECFEPIEGFWLKTYNSVDKTGVSVSFKNFNSNSGDYYEVFAWKVNKNLIAVIFADISERIKKEQILIQEKENAQKNDTIKNDFISNLSHEIRTPMNGILGFINLLSDPALTDIKRKHYISIIQNSGNQLMRTMDDLLEFSKLGTKQVKTQEEETCLNNIFLELFTIFDVKAKENNIPLYLRKGLSDSLSTVLIDGPKLNNVISNLLENALKFTKEGFIEFGYNLIDSNLEIYVKDTGIGIKSSQLESIFERFSKEEKDSSKNIDGLGLGLWIARANTELLGGKINVKSKKNIGTTFLVTIPYKPVLNDLKKNSLTNDSTEQIEYKYTILIAEDEEINYLYLEILLKNKIYLNCIILHAKNGEEAFNFCKEHNEIDFVLMDLKMPKLDGFEAMKLIKDFRPNLPIIAHSAFSSIENKEKVFEIGFDDYISKPISIEVLSDVINKYTEKGEEDNT